MSCRKKESIQQYPQTYTDVAPSSLYTIHPGVYTPAAQTPTGSRKKGYTIGERKRHSSQETKLVRPRAYVCICMAMYCVASPYGNDATDRKETPSQSFEGSLSIHTYTKREKEDTHIYVYL